MQGRTQEERRLIDSVFLKTLKKTDIGKKEFVVKSVHFCSLQINTRERKRGREREREREITNEITRFLFLYLIFDSIEREIDHEIKGGTRRIDNLLCVERERAKQKSAIMDYKHLVPHQAL